jgi:hypothetical protein
MAKNLMVLILLVLLTVPGCVVIPEKDVNATYRCGLSTDKKVLKFVNLLKNDTSFYAWNDEILGVITVPTTAIVSSVYVVVHNTYHFAEKSIKCG